MKKMFSAILAVLLLVLSACTVAPAQVTEPVADAVQTDAPTEEPAATDAATEAPTEPAAEPTPVTPLATGNIADKLAVQMPVLDSLVRSLGIEGETRYDPADAALVWDVLYLMGENHGGTNPDVTVSGETVSVPKTTMTAFARAAFGLSALPEQPEASRSIAVYDEATDAYLLAPSDMGAAEVQLERFYALSNGTILAVLGLYNVDEWMGELVFTLSEDQTPASFYPYTVESCGRKSGAAESFLSVSAAEPVVADLDGDGEPDTLTVAIKPEGNTAVSVKTAAGDTLHVEVPYLYEADVHLGDIDGDGRKEIYISGDVASDDYYTYVCRINGSVIEAADIFGTVLAIEDGQAVVSAVVNVLGTYGALCTYQLADGAFRFERSSDCSVAQSADDARTLVVARDGLPVKHAVSGVELSLNAGAELRLLETDEKTYARLEQTDGSVVDLSLEQNTDEWGYRIAGLPESDWFTELMYAG